MRNSASNNSTLDAYNECTGPVMLPLTSLLSSLGYFPVRKPCNCRPTAKTQLGMVRLLVLRGTSTLDRSRATAGLSLGCMTVVVHGWFYGRRGDVAAMAH